jgi:hypothetical protein
MPGFEYETCEKMIEMWEGLNCDAQAEDLIPFVIFEMEF